MWFDNVSGGKNSVLGGSTYLCVGRCELTCIRLQVEIHGWLCKWVLPECLGSAYVVETHHGWLMEEVLPKIMRPAHGIRVVGKHRRAYGSHEVEVKVVVGVWHLVCGAKAGGRPGWLLFTIP